MGWLFNPFFPCCCVDGEWCLKVQGCFANSGLGWHVIITDRETDEVYAAYDSRPAFEGADCTVLPGNRPVKAVISKDRWVTQEIDFDTPCSSTPWVISPTVTMEVAPGYECPCFGYGCTEPIKPPYIVNDGFGDVTIDGTLVIGPVTFPGLFGCALRPAMGAEGCCATELDPYGHQLPTPIVSIMTPVAFDVDGDCIPNVNVYHDCWAYTGTTNIRVPASGDCGDPDPCTTGYLSPFGFPFPCGNLNPVGSPRVTCSPFRLEQDYTVVGCFQAVYGSTLTLVAMESP